MRLMLAALVTTALAALALTSGNPRTGGTPLWPGARHTREERDRAIQRGMNFIYRSVALDRESFARWGHDLLSAFYNIAVTSDNRELRSTAAAMGRERAIEWRRLNPSVPADADINDVTDLVYGLDVAERLGASHPALRTQLRQAAARFSAIDVLLFDPAEEAPPSDIPEGCATCGLQNARGATVCKRCGARLAMRNRYDLLQDALITTYTGDRAGITLGAHYVDVLQWMPEMRPYPPKSAGAHSYYAGVYGATHLIYTYNDYSQFRVSPDCFPEEFVHLKANLRQAVVTNDAETMGEYLDTLRAFGLSFSDDLVRAGFDFLLSVQNPDGSWGDMRDRDPYGRYHPTWTSIDGLRDYRWGRVLPCPDFNRRPGHSPAPVPPPAGTDRR
jgi:hypothetical protein